MLPHLLSQLRAGNEAKRPLRPLLVRASASYKGAAAYTEKTVVIRRRCFFSAKLSSSSVGHQWSQSNWAGQMTNQEVRHNRWDEALRKAGWVAEQRTYLLGLEPVVDPVNVPPASASVTCDFPEDSK